MLSMVLCDIPYLQQIKFSRLAEIIWADKKLVLHVIQGTRLQKIRQIIKRYCQLVGFSSICCLGLLNQPGQQFQRQIFFCFNLKEKDFLQISGHAWFRNKVWKKEYLPYACHYKPRLVYFYPIFQCGLYCRVVNITDNLCTKNRKFSIFEPNSAVQNQEQFQINSGL